MNAPARDEFLRRDAGSVLIEVVVAVVLLAILVVPLAERMLSAATRADAVRQQADRVANDFPGERMLASWTWGSEVRGAWWRPGPTLYVDTWRSGDLTLAVGLWVDGWFLGEQSPVVEGVLRFGAGTWSTYVGAELVMRVRSPGGVWGPPWRSLVPEADGLLSLAGPAGMAAGVEAQVVAHAPAAANPEFQVSWAQVCPDPGSLGLPLVLESVLSGPAGLSLDGSGQSLRMQPERALDVYF